MVVVNEKPTKASTGLKGGSNASPFQIQSVSVTWVRVLGGKQSKAVRTNAVHLKDILCKGSLGYSRGILLSYQRGYM